MLALPDHSLRPMTSDNDNNNNDDDDDVYLLQYFQFSMLNLAAGTAEPG
jgi:hypothetical protein